MHGLLICDCGHCATDHDPRGCQYCQCRFSIQDCMEHGIRAAKREIAEQWSMPAPS